ncbi:hypothetical protein BDZ89DRAFT_957958, partial [Hymenopellis radicata]
NGNKGACGVYSQDFELVVAVPAWAYKQHSSCWKRVNIQHGGSSIQATVVDLCPSCEPGHVDLSPGAFKRLASLAEGEIPITWALM